ncbi:hypothetical protein H072_4605 [Dactylellina haptotyla CBS 200.50]|uniref:Zn(2)-C6 fungal-type domain-containing protein n=1 Tax=Dactylellina haptotyla (strain CBS 200.50) TaxID=1284197 RepID=S8AK19_DACHA|nr:hypothetical protein H072_4605 [Dactylellina haptotyla CBS 200.50]
MSAKKNVACLACRRRKIKCSQEPECCANCAKANLPCVYKVPNAAAAGVKRRRGPYKKHAFNPDELGTEDTTSTEISESNAQLGNAKASISADLSDSTPSSFQTPSTIISPPHLGLSTTDTGTHPPFHQVLELWHLYTANVDPVTKIIHCPSFSRRLFELKFHQLDEGAESLMLSIYYAAVSSTPAREIQERFGKDKPSLQAQYRRLLEGRLAIASTTNYPNINTLQALTLFSVCLHRSDAVGIHWTTFALTCRIAQQLIDSTDLSIFETQMLRRLWWTICRLEFRTASKEPTVEPPPTIINWTKVPMPLNLNDLDLDPSADIEPEPRQGSTDMSFCLVSFELKRLVNAVVRLKVDNQRSGEQNEMEIALQRLGMIEECKKAVDAQILRYCHDSRPLDWMSRRISTIMLTKLKLLTRSNLSSPTSVGNGDLAFRDGEKLSTSLIILQNMYELQTDARINRWNWFFRDFVQWHALLFTLSEFCKQPKGLEADRAWDVLEPILEIWDTGLKQQGELEQFAPVTRLVAEARRKRAETHKKATNLNAYLHIPSPAPDAARGGLEYTDSQIKFNNAEQSNLTLDSTLFAFDAFDAANDLSKFESGLRTEAPDGIDFGFDASMAAFDWESWANEAQNLGWDFGTVAT